MRCSACLLFLHSITQQVNAVIMYDASETAQQLKSCRVIQHFWSGHHKLQSSVEQKNSYNLQVKIMNIDDLQVHRTISRLAKMFSHQNKLHSASASRINLGYKNCLNKGPAAADRPTRCGASRPPCCTQMSTVTVINWWPTTVPSLSHWPST